MGLLGIEPEDDAGKFHVEEVCFRPLGEQTRVPEMEEDRCVCVREKERQRGTEKERGGVSELCCALACVGTNRSVLLA